MQADMVQMTFTKLQMDETYKEVDWKNLEFVQYVIKPASKKLIDLFVYLVLCQKDLDLGSYFVVCVSSNGERTK